MSSEPAATETFREFAKVEPENIPSPPTHRLIPKRRRASLPNNVVAQRVVNNADPHNPLPYKARTLLTFRHAWCSGDSASPTPGG